MKKYFINSATLSKWCAVLTLGLGMFNGLAAIANETLAGDGVSGYSGDGSAATAARMSNPYAVARDSIGNVYIVDQGNNAIRKVDTSGVISTLISGLNNPQAVCVDSNDNIYVADQDNNQVGFYSATTHSYNASFISGIFAETMCIDKNNKLYVGANFPPRVNKYNSDGSIDVANLVTSAMGLVNPKAMCADALGNIYIADPNGGGRGVLGMYNATNGTYNPSFITGLNGPLGVCVDVLKNIYIANADSGSILMLQSGSATPGLLITGLNRPQGLCIDEDLNLYIAEGGANVIRRFFFPTVEVDFTSGAHMSGPVTGGIKFVGSDDDDVCTFDGSATGSVQVKKGKVSMSSNAPIASGQNMALNGGGLIFTAGGNLPDLEMYQDATLDVQTTSEVFLNKVAGPGVLSVESDQADVVTVVTDLSANTAGGLNMNHGELHINGGKTPNAPLRIANGVDLRLTGGQVSKTLAVDAGGSISVDAGKKVGDALFDVTTYSFVLGDGYFESGSDQIAWPSNLHSYVPYAETDGNPNWLTDDISDQNVTYGGVQLNYSGGSHIQNGSWVAGAVYWVYRDNITSAHPTTSVPTGNDVALVDDVTMQSGSSINLGTGATWERDVTVTS